VKRNLDDYIQNYVDLNFEATQEKYRFKRLLEVIDNLKSNQDFRNILEVGPGRYSVYSQFTHFDNYTILEPIEYFYSRIELKNPKVTLRNETAENFLNTGPHLEFDIIILSSVIHELDDPKLFLLTLAKIIHPKSKVLIVVPNNLSLHRLIGEHEGFAKSGSELTETELRMQQGMSFSTDSLIQFVSEIGYKVVETFTSFVKPHPHFKMHELMQQGALCEEDLDFLYSVSRVIQPYGSEIFAILEKSDD
jgi:SAM-dependent methyltransferase